MTTLTNLPLALSSLDFDSKLYEAFKIERSYMDYGRKMGYLIGEKT